MTGVGGSITFPKVVSSPVDNRDVLVVMIAPSLPWGIGERNSLFGLKLMVISG
jgi:hypothetical protein